VGGPAAGGVAAVVNGPDPGDLAILWPATFKGALKPMRHKTGDSGEPCGVPSFISPVLYLEVWSPSRL